MHACIHTCIHTHTHLYIQHKRTHMQRDRHTNMNVALNLFLGRVWAGSLPAKLENTAPSQEGSLSTKKQHHPHGAAPTRELHSFTRRACTRLMRHASGTWVKFLHKRLKNSPSRWQRSHVQRGLVAAVRETSPFAIHLLQSVSTGG